MALYFIEDFIEDFVTKFSPSKDDIIIALTPESCFHLDNFGINYNIIEYFYNEEEFLNEKDSYFAAQQKWFDSFDNRLKNIHSKANLMKLDLATIYFFNLKTMIDSLVLRSKIINSLFNHVYPTKVVYISKKRKEDYFSSFKNPLPFRKSESLFSRLVPLFCKKHDVEFERIEVKNESLDIHYSKKYFFFDKIKMMLRSNHFIINCFNLYKTGSFRGVSAKFKKNKKLNVFFLKTPGYVLRIMDTAIKQGHYVYYKNNNIIKLNFPIYKSIYSLDLDDDSSVLNNFLLLTKQDGIIDWINDYCKLDISSIILPRINYFIYNICPRIISLVEQYIKFYENYNIDFVITPHEVTVDEFAAISATKLTSSTFSACLQHGDSAFKLNLWDYSEYFPYDLYFTTNIEMEEYIKSRIKLRNFNCQVKQFSERFDIIPKRKRILRNKTVVYVPTMYQWDNTLWCESRLPDTWYFSWHKELINYFSSRYDFNFIWKGIPASNETYDPIPNMINERGYKNIKYATEPFVKWIKKANLVLLDYPSTALYEAAVSGLPVMSLYFAPFNVIRESALKLFGKSLQLFSSFEDGIARIDNFLHSDPNDYIVSITRSNKSLLEALELYIPAFRTNEERKI